VDGTKFALGSEKTKLLVMNIVDNSAIVIDETGEDVYTTTATYNVANNTWALHPGTNDIQVSAIEDHEGTQQMSISCTGDGD